MKSPRSNHQNQNKKINKTKRFKEFIFKGNKQSHRIKKKKNRKKIGQIHNY